MYKNKLNINFFVVILIISVLTAFRPYVNHRGENKGQEKIITFNENADFKAASNNGFSLAYTVTTEQCFTKTGDCKCAIQILLCLLGPVLYKNMYNNRQVRVRLMITQIKSESGTKGKWMDVEEW